MAVTVNLDTNCIVIYNMLIMIQSYFLLSAVISPVTQELFRITLAHFLTYRVFKEPLLTIPLLHTHQNDFIQGAKIIGGGLLTARCEQGRAAASSKSCTRGHGELARVL